MKLYVIVRKDLPKTWYPVQACHATKEYYLGEPRVQEHLSVIILEVENLTELMQAYNILEENDLNAAIFRESHNCTGPTAVCGILLEEEQIQVKHLKLLS